MVAVPELPVAHFTVTAFPLELKRSPQSFTAQDSAALSADVERLLRKAGADVPDSAQYALALKELKRQDCGRDDECLKQLAVLARTLYALYVSVDETLGGSVVATGRVVRSDGLAMGRSKTVSLPRAKGRFGDVARTALAKLFSELGIAQLPAERTVVPDVPRADTVPSTTTPPLVATPPPPPPVSVAAPRAGLRRYAWIPGTATGVAAVGAGVTYALALSLHQQLVSATWPSGPDAIQAARRGETFQWVAAISTGVAAVAGAVLIWFLTSDGEAPVAVGPSARPREALGSLW